MSGTHRQGLRSPVGLPCIAVPDRELGAVFPTRSPRQSTLDSAHLHKSDVRCLIARLRSSVLAFFSTFVLDDNAFVVVTRREHLVMRTSACMG